MLLHGLLKNKIKPCEWNICFFFWIADGTPTVLFVLESRKLNNSNICGLASHLVLERLKCTSLVYRMSGGWHFKCSSRESDFIGLECVSPQWSTVAFPLIWILLEKICVSGCWGKYNKMGASFLALKWSPQNSILVHGHSGQSTAVPGFCLPLGLGCMKWSRYPACGSKIIS